MGKRKDKIIVQDAKPFYQVASKGMNATEVFSTDKTQVEGDRDTDPFNGCQTVPRIMFMHIISAGDDSVKLWENVSFYQKDEPNIIVNKQHINTTEMSEKSNTIVVGDCVKIISGLIQGYYAVVLDSSYDDENKTISGAKYWILKENYLKKKVWGQDSCSCNR